MERASHSTKEPCILWKEPCILRVLHLTIKHQYNRTVHSVCLPPYNVSRSLERLWGLERRQRDHRERVGGWMVVEVRAQGRNNYTPHMYPHTYTKIHAGCAIWNIHARHHTHMCVCGYVCSVKCRVHHAIFPCHATRILTHIRMTHLAYTHTHIHSGYTMNYWYHICRIQWVRVPFVFETWVPSLSFH